MSAYFRKRVTLFINVCGHTIFMCSHCQSLWWGTCQKGDFLSASFSSARSDPRHNVQALYMKTSQLPPSTMPVICPTVNQPLKQAPLLSCPTCGAQHEARSSLYTLWCGIIWDGGGKNTLNFFYHYISLSPGPRCNVHVFTREYVFYYCALHQIRVTLWQGFFFVI